MTPAILRRRTIGGLLAVVLCGVATATLALEPSTCGQPFDDATEPQPSYRDERPACIVEHPLACNPPASQLVVFERP